MKALLCYIALIASTFAAPFQLSVKTTQAVVGITDGWNNSHVSLGLYQKINGRWIVQGEFWKGRLGSKGCAWGLGVSPIMGKTLKKEGDGRAPAGIFPIGSAYGYAKAIKKQRTLKYFQVTHRDLWVEDVQSDLYNRHIKLTHDPSSTWEKKQQMRQNDYAHALKLYIAHNHATEHQAAKKGYGSAIFFHIWRSNGAKATSGCTTMESAKLSVRISKIDLKKNPVYILLPRTEYLKYRAPWKLP